MLRSLFSRLALSAILAVAATAAAPHDTTVVDADERISVDDLAAPIAAEIDRP